MTSRRLLALVLALALVVSACGDDAEGDDGGLRVVATTTILGDVVRNIVGEDAEVEVLMPTGADPHDFHASSQQVARINQADLVVANGLRLEETLVGVLEAASRDGVNVLEVAPLVDPLEFDDDDHHHEEEDDRRHEEEEDPHDEGHDDHHEGPDPHVWMDPIRMVEAVRAIAAELALLDETIDWPARADSYADELLEAHQRIAEILGEVPPSERKLVTNHDSFGYLAARYGFEVVGAVIPGGATLAEPGSRDLARLVGLIEEEGVTAIFSEAGLPDALARAIADEVGYDVAVVELYSDSLGEPGSGADSLIGLWITNAQRIADALG